MTRQKNPEANLKLQYRKAIELSVVAALVFTIILFHATPDWDMGPKKIEAADVEIKVEDIPQTEQIKKAPPPPRVAVPIPTESEEIPEDLTIETTELDISEIPPPPPPPDEQSMYDSYVFIPYDEPPVPVGGLGAIRENLRYPKIAQQAGIEAKVIVGALIDERGNVVKTQILNDSGFSMGFEEAAQNAVMSVKWKPAKQRDNPVKVWVSVPIRFSLAKSAGPS